MNELSLERHFCIESQTDISEDSVIGSLILFPPGFLVDARNLFCGRIEPPSSQSIGIGSIKEGLGVSGKEKREVKKTHVQHRRYVIWLL